MIGFLRFVGILSAGVWLGAAIFFTFGAGPAVFSQEVKNVLGAKTEDSFRYFSGGIAQVLVSRYFYWQLGCGSAALLHLLAERLYSGRSPRRFSLGLLAGLCALALVGSSWLQPKLKELHTIRYTSPSSERRQAAAQSFATWHSAAQMVNLFMIVGLATYLWRLANPPDPTRFVSTSKFWG